VIIREVDQSDQLSLSKLLETIDAESMFMLYEKNERNLLPAQVEAMIASFTKSANSIFFIVEKDSQFIGYILASGGKTNKNKHTAYLVLGVLQRYAGKGIGTKLIERMEEWAHGAGVTRLELTTMVHNEAALRLYKKMGFELEGLKRNSFIIEGNNVDEYYLSKLLN